MLTVFFNYPSGQTANKEYYLRVIRHLRDAIRKRTLELWDNNSWILHHDNAPSHTALILRDLLLLAVPEAQETTAGKSY